ncbi:MAG: lamin tail domain-containing protein [Verrucomicrobiae bacterium]|nr:lamin tail domain-containing protein [Verrucomicrobiae bacterium]
MLTTVHIKALRDVLFRTISLLAGAIVGIGNSLGAPIVSEFLADDPEGGPDWIEIASDSATTIDLSGWQLRDSDTTWQFPIGASLPPRGLLVVFASGQTEPGYQDEDGNYHTSFRLNRDGEVLALYDPTGLQVSMVPEPVPRQIAGVSYGVTSSGNWRFFENPTPGTLNPADGIEGFVEEIEFSVGRGFFDDPFTVELTSATPDAEIRFTTNGSAPDENSTLYEKALEVTTTKVVRAQAFKSGYQSSPTATVTYLFPSDIAVQSDAPEGFPARWKSTAADYEMDGNAGDYAKAAGSADFTPEQARAAIAESLVAIPSLSIVMANDDLFASSDGIYSNPGSRGDRWERPASVEFLNPDGSEGFQIDGGIQVMGGTSRDLSFAKKLSFRLVFKREYGPGWLEYPFFGPEGATRFNTLPLRTNIRDSWVAEYGGFGKALYIADQWAKQTQLDMGQPATRGRFVHLYLNGLYWGLYNPTERPDSAFAESYLPGVREDYDVVKFCCPDRVVDGSTAMWNRLITLCNRGLQDNADYFFIQGRDPDGAPNPEFQTLIDVDNFIDYVINGQYHAANDWPGNYYVMRDGNDDRSEGFKYFTWDNDLAFVNANINLNKVQTDPGHNWWTESPGVMDIALRRNDEYRLRFADHVYRHYFNGGALTEEANAKRWIAIADAVKPALYAEAARWGDAKARIRTVQDHWQAMSDRMVDTFFPRRQAVVFKQLRQYGLYPELEPPQMNQSGGMVEPGFGLQFSAEAPVFYTTDGSDPRLIGDEQNPDATVVSGGIGEAVFIEESSALKAFVPADDSLENQWQLPDFDDSLWPAGASGVGYDTGSVYRDLIGLDFFETMRLFNSTVYLRMAFEVGDAAAVQSLRLAMKYDDGFVAYLNGEKVAQMNAPETATWNSRATDGHPDTEALVFEEFDITASKSLLRAGTNVLAIQGLNDDMNSSDFLIVPELRATVFETASRIPIQGTTTVKARAYNGTEWSALHEARFIVGSPATAENLKVTEIHYRPAAPSDNEIALGYDQRSDFEFVEISNTSTIDAIVDGLVFTQGIRTTPLAGVIPAGASMLIVSNPSAFLTRYGESMQPNILATFADGTNLADGGERIELTDAHGAELASVEYDDAPPWPSAADGDGPSLELDSDGTWRASVEPGGSPGTFEGTGEATIQITGIHIIREPDGDPGMLEIKYSSVPDSLVPMVEWSGDLRAWENVLPTGVDAGNTGVVKVALPLGAVGGYVRLRFR